MNELNIRKKLKAKGAFTLIELIVVIIIIGVLASLALPRFFRTVEYSRASEALQNLSTLRQSMQRCYLRASSYLTCSPLNDATFAGLDVENPNNVAAANRLFAYDTSASAATTFTVRATRNTNAGGDGTSTVTLTDAGVRAGTGPFSGI